MRLIVKRIVLLANYYFVKWKYRRKIKFNGMCIFLEKKNSRIIVEGKGITIHSNSYSNLVGLYQKTIISCRDGGIIRIGSNVGISSSTIYALDSITICDNVMIGANCKIIDNDFHPLDPSKRINQKDSDINRAPILIEENVFIGMNSIILKGTHIGKNSIVGAGSVVHGKFPDNVIIAGNPAKIIKTL